MTKKQEREIRETLRKMFSPEEDRKTQERAERVIDRIITPNRTGADPQCL